MSEQNGIKNDFTNVEFKKFYDWFKLLKLADHI
jgi:hypothetical protein